MAKNKINTWSSDPHFSEVYSQMSESDMAIINEIALNVDEKIKRRVAAAPFFHKYFAIVAVSVFIAFGSLTVYKISQIQDAPIKTTTQDLAQHEPAPKNEQNVIVPSDIKDEEHVIEENENASTPINKISDEQIKNPLNETKSVNELDKTTNEIEKKTENKGLIENKSTDNTRTFVDESNKIITLRVGSASVLSKVNSFENENNTNGSKKVNDPNIGSKVITKQKSTNYSLDDMPSYRGGDNGFISYLNRNLNYKISLMRKEVVNSVNVQFTVTAKGEVENVEVIGEVPNSMEKEIIKVVKDAPDWQAGKKSGKKGSLDIMINIQFY